MSTKFLAIDTIHIRVKDPMSQFTTRYLVLQTPANPFSKYERVALHGNETWRQKTDRDGPFVDILRDGEVMNCHKGTGVSVHDSSEESLRQMTELRIAADLVEA